MPVVKTTTITEYDSGACNITVNGLLTYSKFNTGDEIWFANTGKPVKIKTHDGLILEYEEAAE